MKTLNDPIMKHSATAGQILSAFLDRELGKLPKDESTNLNDHMDARVALGTLRRFEDEREALLAVAVAATAMQGRYTLSPALEAALEALANLANLDVRNKEGK